MELSISIDRGLLLGDGLFETMRVAAGCVPLLERHLDRLAVGCATLFLPPPDRAMLRQAVGDLLTASGLVGGGMRLTVTRGCGPRGLRPPAQVQPTVLLTCAASSNAMPGPVRLGVSRYRRDGSSPLSRVKSLNYLPMIDLLDIIRESLGLLDFRAVADEARRFLSLPQPEPRQTADRGRFHAFRPDTSGQASGTADAARRLWAMSRPIAGTLAEIWLRHRDLTRLTDLSSLRFHPDCYYRADTDSPTEIWPALIDHSRPLNSGEHEKDGAQKPQSSDSNEQQ